MPRARVRMWKGIGSGRSAKALSRSNVHTAVIGLARAFNMSTVAEGVETLDQFNALPEMGCDQLQGYLMSKPVARRIRHAA